MGITMGFYSPEVEVGPNNYAEICRFSAHPSRWRVLPFKIVMSQLEIE